MLLIGSVQYLQSVLKFSIIIYDYLRHLILINFVNFNIFSRKRVCLKPLAWRRKNEYVSEVNEIPDKFSKKSVFAQRKIEHARSNLRQKQRRIAEEEEASDQEKMSAPKKKLKNKVSSVAGKPVRLPTRRLFTSAPQKVKN